MITAVKTQQLDDTGKTIVDDEPNPGQMEILSPGTSQADPISNFEFSPGFM